MLSALLTVACTREQAAPAPAEEAASARVDTPPARTPSVTISGEEAVVVPAWRPPLLEIAAGQVDRVRAEAVAALAAGRLYAEPRAAIPLLLALQARAPDDARVQAALAQARAALLQRGDAALLAQDEDPAALRVAHEIAAVARVAGPDDAQVQAFLARLDRADEVHELNLRGERDLQAGRLGEGSGDNGKGALARFRRAVQLHPGNVRAAQGLAAVESAMLRRGEEAAARADFDAAEHWLQRAAEVRPGTATIGDARERVARVRAAHVRGLRDRGLQALTRDDGVAQARRQLAEILRIAAAGDPAAAELRERIDLATHYGLFRPGQTFTDALAGGGRGPQMLVVPHGGFRMGARDDEAGAGPAERPAHYVRFDRGFALARSEVTVGQFRRFVEASGYRSRAARREHSTVYDERSGNLVRRSGVDWRSDYTGATARDEWPVLHVSAKDAEAYAEWLSRQSGERYRLPSEAEFEYALRAGSAGHFPWGDGAPSQQAGNVTGGEDVSPSGRRWRHAFRGYGDGWWGPAPVASFMPNAFGLHDLTGNVSEWVADCWHAGYRRAPGDGGAWVNPGCRNRVVRGGSWASAPEQVRAAWRLGAESDTTNARLGFRVVREL